ncbi:MAG: heavy metal translocating P-type ATPase [Ruminococcaceae bacterium]|nr:heavy metal translocating P-type ATPase [Oscillospiraceae bacterium]
MKEKFDIKGMTCSACSAAVEKAVAKLPGVNTVNVNLLSNNMIVEFDDSAVDINSISKAVAAAGYSASPTSTATTSAGTAADSKQATTQRRDVFAEDLHTMRTRLIVSFVFLVPLLYLAMGHMIGFPLPAWLHGVAGAPNFAFMQFLLTLPIVIVNYKYYQVGFKTLWRRNPNMDSLIAIGSAAAMLYGIFAIFRINHAMSQGEMEVVHHYMNELYFESAAMILALITLGKYLETRSKSKTSDAINQLINLAPKTAVVRRDDQEIEVPIEEVVVGDLIVVRPGQSIPVDGVVIEGRTSIDQAALTGESIPVEKQVGDKVSAATINKSGFFVFQAEKVGGDTTLAQIIQLVEEAASSKAPISKLADRISGIFVPVVITIAVVATVVWLLLGYGFEFALSIGISVLVISCPCALGLATPVAIMVGTGKGATHGILIKSAEALEIAHTINTVVLDKTGTITEGKPQVTDIVPAEGVDPQVLLQLAASIERPSEHPLADAIISRAEQAGLALLPTDEFGAVPGRGIGAEIEGRILLAGNPAFMQEQDIEISALQNLGDAFSADGKTPLYFADSGSALGVIAVADVIKPTSRDAIRQFKKLGIDVVMLTGDNQRTAEAIRRQLEIDRVVAEVMPQDKEAEIRRIQESGQKVAMIGDGINDAPALARADVGIEIGAGTDIAIESADIVLMRSDLQDAVTAVELSKAVIRNIKQNLFWAFAYNIAGIPLAAGVFYSLLNWRLSPMFAAAAMSLSSVSVVTNALRLRRFKPSNRTWKQ